MFVGKVYTLSQNGLFKYLFQCKSSQASFWLECALKGTVQPEMKTMQVSTQHHASNQPQDLGYLSV